MVLNRLADALGVSCHRRLIARLAQQTEGIVAQSGQGKVVAGLLLEQVCQVAKQQVGAGNAHLALHAHEVIEGDVGECTGFILLAGVGDCFSECIHQVLTIIQPGQKVLAADLAQLFFQLCIAVLWLQNDLRAFLTVVGGGRDRHGHVQFVVVAASSRAIHGHAVFALFGKRLHEFLVLLLTFRGEGVQHRNAD